MYIRIFQEIEDNYGDDGIGVDVPPMYTDDYIESTIAEAKPFGKQNIIILFVLLYLFHCYFEFVIIIQLPDLFKRFLFQSARTIQVLNIGRRQNRHRNQPFSLYGNLSPARVDAGFV